MCPLQRPRSSPPADAGIRLPGSSPCERWDVQDVRGQEPAGNLKILKIKHYCFKAFHIHFVPSALSCALPAFLLFFVPGN
ncbi:unnamed protein product [Staurois parvus]|uniref:Uncharacterized protein n=1 Tax=Staurois parvus TaxID=386267 RepID=A0ABN9EW56_9NEOB|nr:unnamed protein product [Staurois parvus]